MKLKVSNANRSVPWILKPYTGLIKITYGLLPLKIKTFLGKPALPIASGWFFLITLISLNILFIAILLGRHEIVGQMRSYSFHNTALPADFFTSVEIQCNKKQEPINPNDPEQVLVSTVTIKNNSAYPVLLSNGGEFSMKIRPRIWTQDHKQIVRDGISIYVTDNFIAKKKNAKARLEFSVKDIGEIPADSAILTFGLVQEGVSWANSSACSFPIMAKN